jgi:sterol desaturase/sphingolipid hydroxylase (fatty acid hydroxylase superfamily)
VTASLKLLGWCFSLLLACGLVVLVRWHTELRQFAGAHGDVAYYVVLGLLLLVPAKITALVAAYLLELLMVGWSRSSLRLLWAPEASVRLDLVSILLTLLLPQRYLGYLLSFGLLYAVDAYAAHHIDISVTRFLPVWLLQVVCFIVFQSFLQYWMHRLEHAIPALWALHKFHHSADRMSILTSARQTQLTKGVEAGIVLLPMGLVTSPIAAVPAAGSPAFLIAAIVFAYQAFVLVNGYLCHSNLRTGYGWLGSWLLVSPRMHRLHHAVAPAYHDKNFSFDLMFWDRLFGTYATCDPATDVASIPIGLNDNPFNNQAAFAGTLREYFLTTHLVFWRELRRGLAAYLPVRLGVAR